MPNTKEEILNEIEEEFNEVEDDIAEESDDILDLLEETPTEDFEDEERFDLIEAELSQEDDFDLEDFDIDKYVNNNFFFKEISTIPFEEYKQKELEKKDIRSIGLLYEKGYKIKGMDTFDDFLKFKRENNNIYVMTIGLPFEYEVFGIEPKLFVYKSFSNKDYLDMLSSNPDAEKDLDYFNRYMISKCILFPEINMDDVAKLEVGIVDVLLPAIMLHSRFRANYNIKRL